MSSNQQRPLDSGRKDSLGRTVRVGAGDVGGRSDAPPPPAVSGPVVQPPDRFPSPADQFRNLAAAGADPRRADYRGPIREQMLANARLVMLSRVGAPARVGHLSGVRMSEWPDQVRSTVRSRLAG